MTCSVASKTNNDIGFPPLDLRALNIFNVLKLVFDF